VSNTDWSEVQEQKGVAFRALHHGADVFVMPNPWDAGSARLLASLGFPALATTSAGLAHALGRPDGTGAVSRDETLQNVADIAAATDLPVSADLEGCFADDPDGVAETILLAARAGAVGGSVEDSTADADAPIRHLDEAVARVAAAASAARSLPFPFTVTARAENFLHGRPDLADTIARLRAYSAAGADVLYAPGLPDLTAVQEICAAVDRPVNVLATPAHTVAALASCGVRRISVGSGLSRAALGGALRAAREIRELGTFSFAADALPYGEANALMSAEDRHD
jgi:2-methylisocitrate lyase-like PEP mutase family enzyme